MIEPFYFYATETRYGIALSEDEARQEIVGRPGPCGLLRIFTSSFEEDAPYVEFVEGNIPEKNQEEFKAASWKLICAIEAASSRRRSDVL